MRRRGFSLIELLVVVGLIGVLIGILLPTLRRAREQSRSIVCLSNLRQLSTGIMAYSWDNGSFPRPSENMYPDPANWIFFRPHENPNDSPVAPYIGKPFAPGVYRCPSDEVFVRKLGYNWTPPGWPAPVRLIYPYSYSVNDKMCVIIRLGPTLRVNQVRRPADKILVVHESWETIEDGVWAWAEFTGGSANTLSLIHDMRAEAVREVKNKALGNVAFADGHADKLSRAETFTPKHYDPRR